jgi:sugar (pentulose or hexulose) kinase
VTRREWSREILDALEIPAAVLPTLTPAGAPAGRVTARAAVETGIPQGTPVFAGGADTQSALLGSGVYEAGQTGVVLGTTGPVQMVVDHPLIDPAANLWTSCHVVADRWVLESNAGDTGSTYRWLLELLCGADDAGYAAAEAAMAAVGAEPRTVMCFLGPVIFNLRDLNPFKPAGLAFRFPLLHIDRPSRGEILRGFLESIAFAVRGNWEQIHALSGSPLPLLWLSGGMVQSPTLTRIVADVLGVPLAVSTVPESASLGCAILAAVGAGLHASVPEAVAAMTRAARVEPDPASAAVYNGAYEKWRQVYEMFQGWSVS